MPTTINGVQTWQGGETLPVVNPTPTVAPPVTTPPVTTAPIVYQGGQTMPIIGSTSSPYTTIVSGGTLPAQNGYWTEGNVVNGTNVGGGTYVPYTTPAPAGTSYGGGTVSSATTIGTQPIALTNPTTTNSTATTAGALAGLHNPATGMTVDANGIITNAPPPAPTTSAELQTGMWNNLKNMLGTTPEKGTTTTDPEVMAANAQREADQKVVSDATAQLNAVTTAGNVAMQTAESQAGGKGVTTAFLGRQQQEISRQTAIQSLPIAATIAAAQGNLALAQSHLDTLIKNKQEAIDNHYAYQVAQYNSIQDYVTKTEAIQLADLRQANDRAYTQAQDLIKTQATLMQTALANKAPLSVQQAINTSTTIMGAVTAAGIYGTKQTDNSQIIGSDTTGYYNVVKDNQGKVLSTTLIKAGTGTTSNGKIVNINGTDYIQNPNGTFSVPNVPGGGTTQSPNDVAVAKQNALQNAADVQTVTSNYETIKAIANKVSRTPETMTLDDVAKLSNTDQTSIGLALKRIQNPDLARTGNGTENAFEEVGYINQLWHPVKQQFTGQLYDSAKVLDGIKTAIVLYNQRQTSVNSNVDLSSLNLKF